MLETVRIAYKEHIIRVLAKGIEGVSWPRSYHCGSGAVRRMSSQEVLAMLMREGDVGDALLRVPSRRGPRGAGTIYAAHLQDLGRSLGYAL